MFMTTLRPEGLASVAVAIMSPSELHIRCKSLGSCVGLCSLQCTMLRLNDVLKDTHLKEEETLCHYSRQQQSSEQVEVIGRQFWGHIKKTWSAQQWNVLSCEGVRSLVIELFKLELDDHLGGCSKRDFCSVCVCVCVCVWYCQEKWGGTHSPFQLWDCGSLLLLKRISWFKESFVSLLKKETDWKTPVCTVFCLTESNQIYQLELLVSKQNSTSHLFIDTLHNKGPIFKEV